MQLYFLTQNVLETGVINMSDTFTFSSLRHLIVVFPPPYPLPHVSFQAKYVDCSDFGWTNFEEPQAVFHIQRFYSRTNTFVKIEPEREQLSCGQQKAIMVHYILNKDGYGDATSVNFYYVVRIRALLCLPENLFASDHHWVIRSV